MDREQAGLGALPAALLALVLPVSCAGCGALDEALCAVCALALAPPPSVGAVPSVVAACPPTWAVAAYADPVRPLLVAWKDHGRLDLTRVLAEALTASVRAALAGVGAPARPEDVVLLVPVPSTRRAVRARGQDVVAALARGSARALRREQRAVLAAPALRPVRHLHDQAGLGARERAENLSGALAVRGRWVRRVRGRCVVVVDDVVTTGASLAEARRALEAAGAVVVAGAAVAATPLRGVGQAAGCGPRGVAGAASSR